MHRKWLLENEISISEFEEEKMFHKIIDGFGLIAEFKKQRLRKAVEIVA